MDIYFNLVLVFCIIIMFILMKYTINVYLYIGIIMFSVTGLIISVISPLYLITGTNTTIVYSGGQILGAISEPLKQAITNYNYIFQLFYLMSLIGSIIYWTLDSPKKDYD